MPIFSSSNSSSSSIQFGLIIETTGASLFTVKENDSVVQSIQSQMSIETVSTFRDQEEINASNVVFATKISGDQRNEINNSKSGINFKNERAKRIVVLSESIQQNDYVSTNISKDINSSKDSEHFFGYKKNVGLMILGLTGTATTIPVQKYTNDTNIVVLTGANGTELSQSLYDQNYVLINTGSFYPSNFGKTYDTVDTRQDAVLMFSVSSSATAFSSSDFTVQYKDFNSANWSIYTTINNSGTFFSRDNGWYEFIMPFPYDKPTAFALNRITNFLRISSSLNCTYVFKDFRVLFNQLLVDVGVASYSKIDNQNNKNILEYINRGIVKKVE